MCHLKCPEYFEKKHLDEDYKFLKTIGYLGLIPFACGAIASLNIKFIPDIVNDFTILFSIHYASIILSFMGGVLWGFEISNSQSISKKIIILTLLPALWAAFAYFLPIRCFLLALGFIAIYQLDFTMAKGKKSPKWWLKLRSPLTGCAVILLIIIGFNE